LDRWLAGSFLTLPTHPNTHTHSIYIPTQARWANLAVAVSRFERRVRALTGASSSSGGGGGGGGGGNEAAMAFEFVEGLLVQAVREGHWVLLDEINLASAEVRGRYIYGTVASALFVSV
jgi:hypothetical protein